MSITISQEISSNTPRLIAFTSTDSLATILGASYFNDFSGYLVSTDILIVNYSDGNLIGSTSIDGGGNISMILTQEWLSDKNVLVQTGIESIHDSSVTLPVADVANGFIKSSPGLLSTVTLTLPTASDLYSEYTSPQLNNIFQCLFINLGLGTIAISGNTGLTLNLSSTSIPSAQSKMLYFTITNTSTPTMSVYG